MNHQDWKPIVIHKKTKNNDNTKNTVKIAGNKKKIEVNKIAHSIENKADSGDLSHKKITHDMKLLIIKGRNSLKLTQKELANKANLSLQIIQDIESGKAIYNHQHIQKLKRILHIK